MRRLDSALAATLTGLVDRYRDGGASRRLGNERLDTKTCLVTGASRGLGRAVALELARRGARLILPCRRDHDATRRFLREQLPDADVVTPHVDLADIASIHALADRLRDERRRIDVAVVNAGVVTRMARRSAQGFEMMTTPVANRAGRGGRVHALCPGAVDTDIAREAPTWIKPLLYPVMRVLFRSPADAAAPCVYLATSGEIEGQTGLYLHHMTDEQPSAEARDAELGRELFDATQRLLATQRRSANQRRLGSL
jgi:NAD(P)-dependent dehydrogenase (short-subunit alcohol dehydrogenase family)